MNKVKFSWNLVVDQNVEKSYIVVVLFLLYRIIRMFFVPRVIWNDRKRVFRSFRNLHEQ